MRKNLTRKKCLLLLHEIYGINDHMRFYQEYFQNRGWEVIVPNLYNTPICFSYEETDRAYNYFVNQFGFNQVKENMQKLLLELKKEYQMIEIVGFSIGATVAWLLSTESWLNHVYCFYGSQIRNFKETIPRTNVTVVFGTIEQSFNPKNLIAELMEKEQVTTAIYEGQHGFANPFSDSYNEDSAQQMLRDIFGI